MIHVFDHTTGEYVGEFKNTHVFAMKHGLNPGSCNQVVYGQRQSCGGFFFIELEAKMTEPKKRKVRRALLDWKQMNQTKFVESKLAS